MADHDEIDHNVSVIDTSTFHDGDLDLFLDCIQQLCDKNLKKKSKKRGGQIPRAMPYTNDYEPVHDELIHVYGSPNDISHTADPHHQYVGNSFSDRNEFDNSMNMHDYSQMMAGNGHDVTDTDLTYLSEQFNDIFRYFDEDVVPDKTLFEDDFADVDSEVDRATEAPPRPKVTPKKRANASATVRQMQTKNVRPTAAAQALKQQQQPVQSASMAKSEQMPPPLTPSRASARMNRTYGPKKNGWSKEYRELQNKSNAILHSIKANDEFHEKLRRFQQKIEESSEDSDCRSGGGGGHYGRAMYDKLNRTCNDVYRKNRTYNDLLLSDDNNARASLSSSCLSICETDSDAPDRVQLQPYNNGAYTRANVREKILFFNNSTATSRCSSASPFGSSEDDECELYRRNSKRNFQQKRQYFEKFLNNERRMATTGAASTLPLSPLLAIDADNEQRDDAFEQRRLDAIEQFVQTRHLLERIQILIKAISKLDEKRLSTMNLGRLKKFLLFIRDASYKCQEVCANISEEFLQGFENSVMSAEELLFSVYSGQNEVLLLLLFNLFGIFGRWLVDLFLAYYYYIDNIYIYSR